MTCTRFVAKHVSHAQPEAHLKASAVSCVQLQKEGSVSHICISRALHTCASRVLDGLLQEYGEEGVQVC